MVAYQLNVAIRVSGDKARSQVDAGPALAPLVYKVTYLNYSESMRDGRRICVDTQVAKHRFEGGQVPANVTYEGDALSRAMHLVSIGTSRLRSRHLLGFIVFVWIAQ